MLDMQISLPKTNYFLTTISWKNMHICMYLLFYYSSISPWENQICLDKFIQVVKINLFKNDLQTEYNSLCLLFLADHFLILTYHILYVSKLSIQCQRKTQLWHIDMLIVSLETDCN